MRGKNYNTGLRGVLFEARHYEKMGAAVWLYGWLILRQTHQHGEMGCVLGGSAISYREIEEETGFKRRTLECWMRVLRREGYIETSAAPAGVVVRITKAKKFPQGARKFTDGVRKSAGGVRGFAEGATQSRVANERQRYLNQQLPDRIGSSSVDRSIERKEHDESAKPFYRNQVGKTHTQIHKSEQDENQRPIHSGLSTTQKRKSGPSKESKRAEAQSQPEVSSAYQQYLFVREARARWAQLRAERDEEVRRELRVGTGPEVQR
jgi:predicted transcriptional regulator